MKELPYLEMRTDEEKARNRIKEFKKKNTTFISYYSAQQRCHNPKHKSYKNYGALGIKCLFKSYREIVAEIGERPVGKTLERIDREGNYEKGNICWATTTQQNRNKKTNTLTVTLVKKIKKKYLLGQKLQTIANFYKINRTTIADALHGRTWKEVTL